MGVGISSVGIPEISPYTKSEQPRIAGKHSTRHAKTAILLWLYSIPCVRGLPYLLRVGDRCRSR